MKSTFRFTLHGLFRHPLLTLALCLLSGFIALPASGQDEPPIEPGDGGYQSVVQAPVEGLTLLRLPVLTVSNPQPGDDEPPLESGGDEPPIEPGDGGYQSADRAGGFETGLLRTNTTVPAGSPGLLGNYPNPFNPQTTIRFHLDETQPVRLVVYNILGQQVRLLVEGTLPAGVHETTLRAGDLPPGLYLAHLATPTGTFVQRMTLAR
ncbi:T9SS type A sorting domain-containing protein [Rhodocaloribacter litoris]|uniref:T9SS type A sorting domain-containing protein n=1 Tax=Rhodocaloribacter litoris TaxID=2558931 RepID=UPI00141D9995|nr:T9SS type A sorting domain-containing protein [Rhodocaloribacter litoris]QXD15494.1 T9SS type A sorting domain-containing protein [Rhodocaloribacter litoris]GIV61081.1 MAG: hypothetical protein KatS3mg043_2170 [Rhodothermaceae bacterium]